MMHQIPHFEPTLSKIFDHLYANASLRTPGAIEREIKKLIQTGIYSERKINPLRPAFDLTGEEQKALTKDPKFARSYARHIRELYREASAASQSLDKNGVIELSDFDLIYCCTAFSGISFSATDRDLFGDSVELFRSHWSKSQGGQFFTDQQVTRLAIDLLQFEGKADQKLIDLCAGTGGFLLAAIKKVRALRKPSKRLEDVIFGVEADASVAQVGNEAISVLTGVTDEVIRVANSLLFEEAAANLSFPYRTFTHAATNPPFGAKILVKDPSILSLFELSRIHKGNAPKPLPLDILFIEQNFRILKERGKLAIVLPFQTLSGPQSIWIRNWMLERFKILAVVDLPSETFQPYTGTKTSLVVMQKAAGGAAGQTEDVFMACPEHIGHDRRGNPVWKRDVEGRELDETLTDIAEIGQSFVSWTNGETIPSTNSKCFCLPIAEVFSNADRRIDARFYQPSNTGQQRLKLSRKKGFRKVKLGEVCLSIFYPGRFRRSYTMSPIGSVPFLGGTNISQLNLVTEKRVSTADANYQKLKVSKGWILITRSGSTGIVSSVPEEWDGYAISEHVIRIIPDAAKISSAYLLAYLQSEVAQDYIKRGVFGSVIDELSPDYLAKLEVFIPTTNQSYDIIQKLVVDGLNHRDKAMKCFSEASRRLEELLLS